MAHATRWLLPALLAIGVGTQGVPPARSSWHPDDAIVLLGVNLDSTVARAAPHARDHHRTKIELERLTATEPETAAALYYLARWRMLFGDFNGAEPLLQRVRQIPDEEPVGFPAHSQWRWPPFSDFAAMATFALGNLNDLRGDHEAAIVLYRELLEALTPEAARVYQGVGIYVDLGVYLESLIAEPYTGGPREVLRQIEAQRAVE